jgi:hypothetical protein
MELETPEALLARLKLGREEYCQRLLTMLILDAPYPPWNTSHRPSTLGQAFLADLDGLSFGEHERMTPATFVDELELPARHQDESGGWPDYGVVWEDRLWIIELKTEAASHRPGQLEHYLDLAAHHYPSHHIDVTYLTPPMRHEVTAAPADTHVTHLTWPDVLPLIAKHWAGGTAWQQSAARTLDDVLSRTGTSWTQAKPDHSALNEAIAIGADIARLTADDGQQRAVDVHASGIEPLHMWRRRLDEVITSSPPGDPLRQVRPWVWSVQTSGGVPLTPSGDASGYELRLSRYRHAPR